MSLTTVILLGQLDKAATDATASTIAEMAVANIRAGYGLEPVGIAKWINTQMPKAQRLYRVELEKAARLLETLGAVQRDLPIVSADAWVINLSTWLGWRIVVPTPCTPGFTTDPVSRECVRIPQEIAPKPIIPSPNDLIPGPDTGVPPPIEDEEKAAVFGIPVVPLMVGALVLLVLRRFK